MAGAVVVGGAGALGSAIVRALRRRALQQHQQQPKATATTPPLQIVSVDVRPCPEADGVATHSVVLQPATGGAAWHEAGEKALEELRTLSWEKGGFGCVFHAAGGWAGGAPGSPGFLASVDGMWRMNGQSAALAAHLAGALLPAASASSPTNQPPPLTVLTGAGAALDPAACAGMLGYGMAKAATHFLVRSLAAHFEAQSPKQGACVLAVLPTTLDTPANRQAMPGADFAGWTKPEDIAAQLAEWAFDPATRPRTGGLLKVVTSKGRTSWVPASSPASS